MGLRLNRGVFRNLLPSGNEQQRMGPVFQISVVLATTVFVLTNLAVMLYSGITHDELIYLIKSWWLVSGTIDWYSESAPIRYLPGAYLIPGITQLLLGQGLLEARLIPFFSQVLLIFCLFIYCRKLFGVEAGYLSVVLYMTSSVVFSWSSITAHSLSNLLILLSLASASDHFVRSVSTRIAVISILFTLLVFIRLNHIVTVVLLLAAIWAITPVNRLRIVGGIMVASLSLCTLIVLQLPSNFFEQVNFSGLLSWFSLGPKYEWSSEYLGALSQLSNSDLPKSTSVNFLQQPQTAIGVAIADLLPRFFYGWQSFQHNFVFFLRSFGLLLFGALLVFFKIPNSHRTYGFILSLVFIVYVCFSFIKGYDICSGCPIDYSSYFLIPIVIGATVGYTTIKIKPFFNIAKLLIIVVASSQTYITAEALLQNQFSAAQKHDLASIATKIATVVPRDEMILPVGSLGPPFPIRMGAYLANRMITPAMLNPVFSFRPQPLDIPMTPTDYAIYDRRALWTPQHLLEWTSTGPNYILKPTYLYYDDHPYRFWFRSIYYPREVRDIISAKFVCKRLTTSESSLYPIDICSRKPG